jgi:hypothetical protein
VTDRGLFLGLRPANLNRGGALRDHCAPPPGEDDDDDGEGEARPYEERRAPYGDTASGRTTDCPARACAVSSARAPR